MQNYKDEPTAELAIAFRESLQNYRPAILHKALGRAMRRHTFRPNVAQIIDCVETEIQLAAEGNRPKYLNEPQLSAKEREAALEDPQYLELKKKLLLVAKEKSV